MDAAQNEAPSIIDNRYIVQERLGSGGMGTVYLAYDLLTKQLVALKHLTTPTEQLRFQTKSNDSNLHLALAQEFRTLASLRHPHIISVYDFGFDKDNLPYYTMEHLVEAQDIVQAGKPLPLNGKVNLIIQMLQAIQYLHRRGVLHRDLKPDNVLVVENHVRVMDFGLAVETKTGSTVHVDSSNSIAGTIAYMSPEIFVSERFTRETDLWAVGIMLYELLVERYPFTRTSITDLIMAIIDEPIDFAPVYHTPEIFAVLFRLLEKKPQDRYNDASKVIGDLSAATDQPLPAETQAIREGYLKASRFVGREFEVTTLKKALENATDKTGSAWLIGGESGVGKSRLLDEIRISAMVSGFWVLQGQATTEAGTPYEIWGDLLRKLSLRVKLSDLEAGILKGLVPDLEDLLGYKVPEPPEVDEQTSKMRLMSTIDSMFRQQQQPVLLLFEDLQWAKDGVELLSHLTKYVHELPVVIIASFRDDEAHDLTKRLSNMRILSLKRLDLDSISELATNILGTYGQQPQVIDFLQRETEGNVFFLVEVIRTLAEQSGRLDQVGRETLPIHVFAQGIQTIIQNRLEKVSAEDRPYLDYAAVLGRVLDIDVLRAAFPDLDIEFWLLRLTETNIIEVNNNQWRFTHDKLREVLLNQLSPTRLRQYHSEIADAIARVHSDSYSGLIAYHLEKSLDFEQRDVAQLEKTIFALARAASANWAIYANNQALELYQRVVALEKIHRQWVVESGDLSKVIGAAQLAQWYFQLALAQFLVFKYADTKANFQIALSLLNQPMPVSRIGVGRELVRQTARQTLHRLFPRRYINQASQEMREHLKRITEIISRIGTAYYMTGDTLGSLYASLENLNLNEKLGPSPELAQAYAQMCLIVGSMGSRAQADIYYDKAVAVLDQINDPIAEAGVYILSSVYYVGQVDYVRVRRDTSRATTILLERGDVWMSGNSRQIYATTFFGSGDYQTAYSLFEELLEIANEKRILQQGYTSYTWLARMDLLHGKKEEALRKIEHGLALLQEMQSNNLAEVDPWALAARIFLHNGLYMQAYEAAEEASKLAVVNRLTGQWGKHVFPQLIEVYLALCEQTEFLPADADQLLQKAKIALRSLLTLPDTMAKVFSHYSIGCIAHAEGKTNQAYKAWQKGLVETQKYGLPLEEALCHRALGHYLPETNLHKVIHQRKALAIFKDLNVTLYLEESQTL